MSSPPPTRLQLTQAQYLADLASLFRRYKFPCGSPACLKELAPQLHNNPALRGDLFSLCTAISHMGESDLQPDELLALVGSAVGGPAFLSGELEFPPAARAAFLSLNEQWSTRTWDALANFEEEPQHLAGSAAARHADAGFNANFHKSAGSGGMKRADQAPAACASRTISANMRLGDLTLSELKIYLDEVETRVDRLSPHLGAAAFVEDPLPSGWTPRGQEHFRELPQEAPGEPEAFALGRKPAHGSSTFAIAAGASTGAASFPAEIDEESPSDANRAFPPADLLAQPNDSPDELGTALLCTAEDSSKRRSRRLRWLAAALIIIACGSGYGYRYVHRAPLGTSPTMVPMETNVSEPAASGNAVRPRPTAPEPQTEVEIPPATEFHPGTLGKHRVNGASPHLLPREVQVEAEATDAAASGKAERSPGFQQRPSTLRQYSSAPIVRSTAAGDRPESPSTIANQPQ